MFDGSQSQRYKQALSGERKLVGKEKGKMFWRTICCTKVVSNGGHNVYIHIWRHTIVYWLIFNNLLCVASAGFLRILLHLLMLSPRGGGGGGGWTYVGHLTSIAFPPSGIWLRIWVSGFGHLLFFAWRNVIKSHCLMCLSVRRCANHLGIELAW